MNDSSEVKLHFLDYWRIIKIRAGLVVLTFLLVMVTAGVTTYFVPRQYFSKVTMEVKPDGSTFKVFGAEGRGYNDPMFVPTQFQVIQKKEILYPVIEKLKLIETWSQREGGRRLPMEVVHNRLVRMMELKEVRNTGLIEIGVYSIDNQEAANIANAIAVEYKERRLTDLDENLKRALAQLGDELEKQRKRVEEAAVTMAQARERDSIVDPDPESSNAVISPADRNIVAIEQDRNQQSARVVKIEGAFEQIQRMKPEELREVLRTLQIEDQNVVRMVENLQIATAKEAELYASGLGIKHPQLNAWKAQKEVFRTILSDALTSVRQNQAALLEIERRALRVFEAKFEEAVANQLKDKQKTGAYIEAKTNYLQAKKIFEAAQIKYSTEMLEKQIDFDPAKIWEKAEPSSSFAKPNVPAYVALSAVIGLVLGVGLAFFIEYLDTSVKTLDDVEKHLQVPVLAVVPKDVSTLIKSAGDSPDAEAYRILRANVEFNKPNRNANTFTLVSGGPGEGKSTTLNNLAFTCAQGGYNVLVVDADLRRPTQHKFFDQDNRLGLIDYLQGQADLDEIIKPTKLDNLSFIPSGTLTEDAMHILNSRQMVELIGKLKQQYDLVFFDSPPILGVSDAKVLASECDVTIMVVQHRRFPRAMLLRVKQAVQQAGGTLIGVVLNNVDSKHDDGYYYYNSYQDYYARPVKEKKSASAPAPRRPGKTEPSPVASIAQAPAKNGPPTATVSRPRTENEDEY
jgi:succinoglycan biosynthesis transport protein ExoP